MAAHWTRLTHRDRGQGPWRNSTSAPRSMNSSSWAPASSSVHAAGVALNELAPGPRVRRGGRRDWRAGKGGCRLSPTPVGVGFPPGQISAAPPHTHSPCASSKREGCCMRCGGTRISLKKPSDSWMGPGRGAAVPTGGRMGGRTKIRPPGPIQQKYKI